MVPKKIIFLHFCCRWVSSLKPDLKIVEPVRFEGTELGVIETTPNLVRNILIIMKVEKEQDQDEILSKIKNLVQPKAPKTDNEKMKKQSDIWD